MGTARLTRFDGVIIPGFEFTPPVRRQPVREPRPRKQTKPITYPIIHVEDRHGDEWPRQPGKVYRWTGWLTHREYNLIEGALRWGHSDIYFIGDYMGLKPASVDRMWYSMEAAGIIEGDRECFLITAMARILFDMTEQFILGLEFEDEETA